MSLCSFSAWYGAQIFSVGGETLFTEGITVLIHYSSFMRRDYCETGIIIALHAVSDTWESAVSVWAIARVQMCSV